MLYKPGILFILGFLSTAMLFSQGVDNLSNAQHLHTTGKTKEAARLLDRWIATHPKDANALWLSGKNEFWRKNFRNSRQYYTQAIRYDPKNIYLKLDFAEVLLSMGRFSDAEEILSTIPISERQNPHYLFIMAKKSYWEGDVIQAKRKAELAQKKGSIHAVGLHDEIQAALLPQISVFGSYFHDSQPIKKMIFGAVAEIQRNRWLDLHLQAIKQYFQFDSTNSNASAFEVGNRFRISKTRSEIGVTGGIFQMKNQKPDFIGMFTLAQHLPYGMKMTASAAQMPYLNTHTSLDTSIIYKQITSEFEWSEPHGFWLKAGSQHDFFEDNNLIRTGWVWALSPPMKINSFNFRLGWSYSFTDSRKNRFVSEKNLETLISTWNSMDEIAGQYDLIFTPENMQINAALLVIEASLTKRISLTINGKYGFFASADNPYLYLDKNQEDKIFISKDYEDIQFTPIDIATRLQAQISEKTAVVAQWTFSRNLFYDAQEFGFKLKMVL